MNGIHEQVAQLQHKIDYLIERMEALTGDTQLPQSAALRSPSGRKPVEIIETDRPVAPKKEIGLNRYRALQTKERV